MNDANEMFFQLDQRDGFFAALDQSGGSTPAALQAYGIHESAYGNENEMFRLMHEMRTRVMTAPAFSGDRIVGAILFERTMDGLVHGVPTPSFLWQQRGVVPFLKVDKGLEEAADGVQMMKPIDGLDALLDRAKRLGVLGTKMRSVIHMPSPTGIAAIVKQQFSVANQILDRGLVPILEPEVSIKSPGKGDAEIVLRDQLLAALDQLSADRKVVFKLTIPDSPDLYQAFVNHPNVIRVLALSGGYTLEAACERLSRNHGMIASFSRALLGSLRQSMTDVEFDAELARVIEKIFRASVTKQ